MKKLDQIPPQVPQEDDDYGDDDFQNEEQNKQEEKKHARTSTATSGNRDPSDIELDQIFVTFKSHISKENRKVYQEQCQKADPQGFQYVSLSAFYRILVNIGNFTLSIDDVKRLLIAIEAYSGDTDQQVKYNMVIRSILEREVMAHSGRFAKRQGPKNFSDTGTTASFIQQNYRSLKDREKKREEQKTKNENRAGGARSTLPSQQGQTLPPEVGQDEKQASQVLDEITKKYQGMKKLARNLTPIFQLYDLKKEGKVDYEQFKNALKKANIYPVINKEPNLKKLFEALDFDDQGKGDKISYAPLIDAIQNVKKLREIRSPSGQMINISSFLARAQQQQYNVQDGGSISSPVKKSQIEETKRSMKMGSHSDLESMAVRGLPQIKEALQQLLQQNYPSRMHLGTVVFGEVQDDDLIELQVFQKKLDPKIIENISVSELRRVHEAQCMNKGNNKKAFLDIIWGQSNKYQFQGKILSIETGGAGGASGGPPTFKPGVSDGKFFQSQDSAAIRTNIDKKLDRNLKEFCETIDRQVSESNRPLEELLRYNINEADQLQMKEKEGQDGLSFKEFQDLYCIYLSDRDPAIAATLFELLVSPSTKKKPVLLIKDLIVAIQSRRPAVNLILRIQNFLQRCSMSAIGVAKRKQFEQKLQQASAQYSGKLIQIAALQKILNQVGIHAIEADLIFLRTQGLTRSPQDFRSLDVAQAMQSSSISPGHAKRRADCVDLIELRKRSQPKISEAKRQEQFSKIQEAQRLQENYLADKDQKAKLAAAFSERKQSLARKGPKGNQSTDRETAKSAYSKVSATGKQGKTLSQKIKSIVKVPQKIVDNKAKQQLFSDFKQTFVYPLISKVIAHGESILFGRQVQNKFQNRPVLKSLFPSAVQIKSQLNGILPRSLTGYDKLGRILYLDGQNKLQQISVTAENEESLKPVGLGTRPPLKFHPIIDLACDRKSGRIYTLNRNWVLQVWNIEQTQTVPMARLTVVNKDVRQDYIKKSYPKRFFGSKPIFLALNEQNRQVLIINTSCVDGSFVFIDPISMSVFKRIRLNYSDYEPDKQILDTLAQFVVHVIKMWNGSLQNFIQQVFMQKQPQIEFRRKDQASGFLSPTSFATPDKYNDSFGATLSAGNKGSRFSGGKSSQKEAINLKLKGFEIKFNALVYAMQQECGIKFQQASHLVLYLDKKMNGQIQYEEIQKAFIKMQKKLGITQMDDQQAKVKKVMHLFPAGHNNNIEYLNDENTGTNFLQSQRTGAIVLSQRGGGHDNQQSLKWPDWIVNQGRVQEVKKTLFEIANMVQDRNIELNSAFTVFDRQNNGYIEEQQFENILHKLLPTLDNDQIDLIFRLIDRNQDSYISYKEFCRYISPQAIKILRQQTSDQDTRQILQQPIEKEATLKYVLRRCHEVGINLKKIFLGKDQAKVNILPKMTFERILKSLPLGLMDQEIDQLMQSQISFDGKGNVDYTQILNSQFYVSLERIRDQMKIARRKQQLNQRSQVREESHTSPNLAVEQTTTAKATTTAGAKVSQLELSKITQNQAPQVEFNQIQKQFQQELEAQKIPQHATTTSDSRKVIVQDLCYIGDLDLIAYTTVQPRSSSIFISQAIAVNVESAAGLLPSPTVHSQSPQVQDAITQQKYQMIAILQAHKNSDPPTIKYIPQSGCLISGEKSMAKDDITNQSPQKKPYESAAGGGYQNFIQHGGGGPASFQIIVWNIQRDMIELFQSKQFPWRVAPARRFNACNGSILDICYLKQAQLLACSSTDHTIRFFDPTAKPYALSDPQNIPHIKIKPGQYKPMQMQYTQKNQPFSEVNRFYTKDAVCYSLSTIVIDVPSMSNQNSKNQVSNMRVQWLLNLRLTKSQNIGSHMVLNQGDLICNAIQRMQIEVPVNRHDDPVPANVFKQCKMMMQKRRKLGVARFKATIHKSLDKTLSQVTVQRAMFQQIEKLLKRSALLGRDSGSGGMSQQPVRQVYKMLTTLPQRGKFSAFLSQFGDKKQLSISQAFHSLSKLCQISPGRTTQLQFEKCVSDFYHKNEQSFINDGCRQWGNIALQKLANYIRHNGIDIDRLRPFAPSMNDRFLTQQGMKQFMRQSCGRQRLQSSQAGYSPAYLMDQSEFQSVIQALDPYMFDRIPFKSIQQFFKQQISAYYNSADEKPKKIISQIRNKLIPKKKIQLQQALQKVDYHGDGYISLHQFLRAFQISQIGYDKELLRQLFNALSQTYTGTAINVQQPMQQQQHNTSKYSNDQLHQNTLSRLGIKRGQIQSQKMMSVTYFMQKLFSEKKDGYVYHIARILTLLKAGLIYRGIKFQNIFAEESGLNYLDDEMSLQEQQNQQRSSGSRHGKKSTTSYRNSSSVDLTMHQRKIATQITKDEFVRRISNLAITNVTQMEAVKLANFISINSSNKQVIQLDHFLHFIKRVESADFPSVLTGKRLIPIICAKLLANKHLFTRSCEEVGDFGPTTPQDEKMLQEADVRSVLLLFSIPHSHIQRFLADICRSQPIHITDLITKIEFQINDHFKASTQNSNEEVQDQNQSLPYNIPQNINQRMVDLKQTEYFRKLRKAIANSMIEQQKIIELFQQFDTKKTGKIKIHHLINVLKYNLGEASGLDDYILAGLQFQLQSISQDNSVDYLQFFEIFLQQSQHNQSNIGGLNRSYMTMHSSFLGEGLQGDAIADNYTKEDIQRDLIRLSHFISDGKLSIRDAFCTFNRNRDGKITQDELRETLRLIDFQVQNMDAMWRFLDVDCNGWLSIDELARKIVYAKDVKDDFDPQKWILAAKHIRQTELLRKVAYNIGGVKAALTRVIERTKGTNQTEYIELIVMGQHLQEALQKSGLGFTVQEIQSLVTFGIIGSRRGPVEGGTSAGGGAGRGRTKLSVIQQSKESDNKSVEKFKQKQGAVPLPKIDLDNDLIITENFFKSLDIVISQREYEQNSHKNSKNILSGSSMHNNSMLGSMSKSIHGGTDLHLTAQMAAKQEAENINKIQKNLTHEEYLLVEKLQEVFIEREFSFYQAINDIYVQSDQRTRFLLMKDFNSRIRSLSLPLTVRDYRRLLHIADPEQSGKINVIRFIKLFENSKIRFKRIQKLIKKCAMLFYLDYSKGQDQEGEQGQVLDQLYNQFKLFDADDDGLISRGEFHSAIRQFGLELSSLQIDDLMRINEFSDEGYLNYQDFIQSFRNRLVSVQKQARRQMEGFLLIRIKELLQAKDESLYRILQKYDSSNKGQILAPFVEKALLSLGMKRLSLKQVLLILQMGGFTDSTVKIDRFCRKIYECIDRQVNDLTEAAFGLLRDIYRLIRGRGLSLFQAFCSFDQTLKLRITKLEFMANLNQLSLRKQGNNFEKLWCYVARSKNKTLLKNSISYHTFLRAFIEAGTLKLQKESQSVQIGQSGMIKKFFTQLKKVRLTPDKFWQRADSHNIGTLSAFDFESACKRCNIILTSTEFELCFNEMIDKSAQGKMMQRSSEENGGAGSNNKRLLTYKMLTQAFTRGDSQANVILQTARKLQAYVVSKASQGVTWKKIFEGTSQNSKSSSSSAKAQLNVKQIRQKLRSLRSGASNQNIDHLLNFMSFPRDGRLSSAAFQDQLAHLIQTHQQKIDSTMGRLKQISIQVRQAIDKQNIPYERVFAQCDEQQIGCLNVLQFINFLSAFGINAKKDEVKLIFQTISSGRTHIQLEKVKSFLSGSIFHSRSGQENKEQQQLQNQAAQNYVENQEKKNQIFERIRQKLKQKRLHLEYLVKSISLSMKEFLTVKALKQIMLKAELILSKRQAMIIIQQMAESFGRSELQIKDLIEFMLRKKVDTIDATHAGSEGQLDPAIVLTVSSMQKAFKKFEIPHQKAFTMLQKSTVNQFSLPRGDFILAVEGMQLGLSYDDLITLFNFIDQRKTGSIQKHDFLDVFKFVLAAASGIQMANFKSNSEEEGGSGVIKRKQMTKKQQLMHLLKTIGMKFEEKGISFRQMSSYFDKNKTGLISRAEFAEIIRNFKLGMDLDSVRKIAQHFDQNGTGVIQVSQVLANIQEIMNQGSDGLYSLIQSRPILHKIMSLLGSETGNFLDQIASKEKALFQAGNRRGLQSALTTKTGISRKQFLQALENFRIKLTEDETSIIISAFAYSTRPHMLDIHRLFNVFDSFSEAQNLRNATNSAQFKKSIIQKIVSHLKRNNITIMQCFSSLDQKNNGLVSNEEMIKMLEQLGAGLTLRDATKLIQLFDENKKGMISLNAFLRNFWSAYSVSMGSVLNGRYEEQDDQEERISGVQKREQVRFIHAVLKEMKRIHSNLPPERVFAALDQKKLSFLTMSDMQAGMRRVFDLVIPMEKVMKLFRFIDSDKDGLIKLSEFKQFWNFNAIDAMKKIQQQRKGQRLQYEIFDHLTKALRTQGKSCSELFRQIDIDGNGYIDTRQFTSLVERIGFTISEQQIYEMLQSIDDNFDGKISFSEFEKNLKKYGGYQGGTSFQDSEGFKWRDKAIQAVIKGLNTVTRSFSMYLKKYDSDGDGVLTPHQFRIALKDIGSMGLSECQIQRILHILSDRQPNVPIRIVISNAVDSLQNYDFSELLTSSSSANTIQVNETLFVHVVQRFDGLSALSRGVEQILSQTRYLMRNFNKIALINGGALAAWQRQFNSSLTLSRWILSNLNDIGAQLANTVLQKLRYRATSHLFAVQSAITDQQQQNDEQAGSRGAYQTMTYDSGAIDAATTLGPGGGGGGSLKSIPIPNLQNQKLDIDSKESPDFLDCGAKIYDGIMPTSFGAKKVVVIIYGSDELGYVSPDGKPYRKHLDTQLSLHRYLQEQIPNNIFHMYGKIEKSVGLQGQDKELWVVYEAIDENNFITLEEFMKKNGGLLQMPMLYGTDAALNIARFWAKQLFDIVEKVHQMGITFRRISLNQLMISRDGNLIKLKHCRGAGVLSQFGKLLNGPDITLFLEDGFAFHQNMSKMKSRSSSGDGLKVSQIKSLFKDAFLAPQHLLEKFNEHTMAADIWSIGTILFGMLFGRLPRSFIEIYDEWMKWHGQQQNFNKMKLPLLNPGSNPVFMFNPFNDAVLHIKKQNASFDEYFSNSRNNLKSCQQILQNLSVINLLQQQAMAFSGTNFISEQVNSIPGQQKSALSLRLKHYAEKKLVKKINDKVEIPNQLSMLLDIIATCLDMNPHHRPNIIQLQRSPLFIMDTYQQRIAKQFANSALLYRSPIATVYTNLTVQLRKMCAFVLREPSAILDQWNELTFMYDYVYACVKHFDSNKYNQLQEINIFDNVAPNAPLARQIFDDKVLDMLLFLTLRYMKQNDDVKNKVIQDDMQMGQADAMRQNNFYIKKPTMRSKNRILKRGGFGGSPTRSIISKSVKWADKDDELQGASTGSKERTTSMNSKEIFGRFTGLLKSLIREMHSYKTPMAPYPEELLTLILKAMCGEEYELASDNIMSHSKLVKDSLKNHLKANTFLRNQKQLKVGFVPDQADILWKKQKMRLPCHGKYVHRQSHWTPQLAQLIRPVIQEGISQSGVGKKAYKVLLDYILSCDSNFENDSILSNDMNNLRNSYIIPSRRTSAYYSEILPMVLNLIALRSPLSNLGKAGRRSNLANLSSLLQTGTSDKIKLCLDMRIPKYIVHFLADSDAQVRTQALNIFYQISRGLQDNDILGGGEIASGTNIDLMGSDYTASQLLPIANKFQNDYSVKKGATAGGNGNLFDEHKNFTLANYLDRSIASGKSAVKRETKKFLNFAYDIPNLHFLANKRFLREMAACFQSQLYVVPIVRILKRPGQVIKNKIIALRILQNLLCGAPNADTAQIIHILNAPATDTYISLAKLLVPPRGRDSTRSYQILLPYVKRLFQRIRAMRRPDVLKSLTVYPGIKSLMNEQKMDIPPFIDMVNIMQFVNKMNNGPTELRADLINVNQMIKLLKNLRCWLGSNYSDPKAVQRQHLNENVVRSSMESCMELLFNCFSFLWDQFDRLEYDRESQKKDQTRLKADLKMKKMVLKSKQNAMRNKKTPNKSRQSSIFESQEKEIEHLQQQLDALTNKKGNGGGNSMGDNLLFIQSFLSFLDWLCGRGFECFFIGGEGTPITQFHKQNLALLHRRGGQAISMFRRHAFINKDLPLQEIINNQEATVGATSLRKYDIFPLNKAGTLIQNIMYHLLRKNSKEINQLLNQSAFGDVLGQWLILDMQFVIHCIDHGIQGIVLIDTFVKKNQIRINSFQALLMNQEKNLHYQFLNSGFIERLVSKYLPDERQFNASYSKITLEMLAFRKCLPLRMEAVTLIRQLLASKSDAYQLYADLVLNLRRSFTLKSESARLKLLKGGLMLETTLLLFSVFVQADEEHLHYLMKQEGSIDNLQELFVEKPSLNSRFPTIGNFIMKQKQQSSA